MGDDSDIRPYLDAVIGLHRRRKMRRIKVKGCGDCPIMTPETVYRGVPPRSLGERWMCLGREISGIGDTRPTSTPTWCPLRLENGGPVVVSLEGGELGDLMGQMNELAQPKPI